MKNRLLWTIIGLTLTCGASAGLALALHHEPVTDSGEPVPYVEKQPSSSASSSRESSSSDVQDGYILKEYNGKIGVFTDNDAPDMVLDVFVRYLPAYDQGQLQQGIHVETYDQLVKLIEDYIS